MAPDKSQEKFENPHFLCPITYEVMKDPVVALDGHTYERTAITDCINKFHRSPLTNEPIGNLLIPNRIIKTMIEEYYEQGVTKPELESFKDFLFERISTLHNVIKLHFKTNQFINEFKLTLNSTTYNNIILTGNSKNERLIKENVKILGALINVKFEEKLPLYPVEDNYLKKLSKIQQREISQEVDQKLQEVCSLKLLKKQDKSELSII